MKPYTPSLCTGLALLFATAGLSQVTQPGDIPGHLLVMLTPNGSAQAVVDDLRMLDGTPTGLRVDHEASAPMRIWLLKFDHTAIPQQRMLDEVKRHPHVMIAQNDHPVAERLVPNDTQYGQQWHHPRINSPAAWDISTGGVTATGDTIVVCIIEGANLLHNDLVGNRWLNHGEIPGNGVDDDGNGYVDDRRGWNPAGNNDNVYNGGHGTNVAGMIGAKGNNALAVTGANWNVKMMCVTYASTSQAAVIAAYTYPLVMRRRYNQSNGAQGAFVVATNASWGIDGGNPANYPLWCAIYDTLGTAGILNCGATANNNVNVDVVGDMPTACPSPFMVSVTATNSNDLRTFSAYGATTIDVGAPGEDVVTTSGSGNSITTTSGTSFASPLTAGVIGLLYSAPCPSLMSLVHGDPMAGALYIRQMLFDGVDQVGNLPGNTVTGGRINSGNSMNLIMAACGSCPAPIGGNVVQLSTTSATYSWNSFAGGPYTVRYRVQGSPAWTEVTGIDDNFFTATGLTPCITYEFEVRSDCASEPSAFGAPALLTPPPAVTPSIGIQGLASFCADDGLTLTSSAPFGNTWSTGATTQSITVYQSGSYTVTVDNGCEQLTSAPVLVTAVAPAAPTASNVSLPGPGSATLNATGNNITWYDAPGGNVVGTGNTWNTPFLSSPTTFWATSSDSVGFDIHFGAKTNNTAQGQYHTNASFWQVFTANGPFTIKSVKVYANSAGNRSIGLVNMPSGTVVQQATFNIPNGQSRVQLNFQVPGPGQYGLRVMSGNPGLWRDGVGSAQSYPYPLGPYGAVTNSTATTNPTGYYYFFYDWEVRGPGLVCESDPVPVTVDMPTGVTDTGADGSIAVFPNPADGEVIFSITGPLAKERLMIELLDQPGRLVMVTTTDNGTAVTSTAGLAEGMYVYRVSFDGTEVGRGRLVVTHPR